MSQERARSTGCYPPRALRSFAMPTNFPRRFLPLLLLATLTACAAAPSGGTPGQVEHVVLVWLNESADQAARDRIVATARSFPQQIPGIVSLSIGDALPSDRDVVDDSFDLALVMRFASQAALEAYDAHPVHTRAVTEVLAPNLRRIVVYDVMVR